MKITNIEVVDHVYTKDRRLEYYVVRYSSGKVIKYMIADKLPKTIRAFMKSHYDEYFETKYCDIYKYKAINIIE